jgi:DNA-binding transcriptional LysR family regulator
MLPHTVAARSVQEGLLEEMPLGPGASLAGTVFLVYPSSGEVPRKVTAFRDFLVDWLKKSPLE